MFQFNHGGDCSIVLCRFETTLIAHIMSRKTGYIVQLFHVRM